MLHLWSLFHHSKPLLRSLSSSAATATATKISVYLRRARAIDRLRLHLHRRLLPSSAVDLDPSVAAPALRSAPSPSSALSLFLSLPESSRASAPLVLSFARSLSLSGRPLLLRGLLRRHPCLFPALRRLRLLSAASDLPSSLLAFRDLPSPSPEAYNLLISAYVSNSLHSHAASTFSSMLEKGILPNSRTFTILIAHLASAGNLHDALQVFDRLPLLRIRRTTRQYDLLSEALLRASSLDRLESLLAEMQRDGIMPGRATRSAILTLRELGRGGTILDFEADILPDSRIRYVVSSSDDDEEEVRSFSGVGSGDRVSLKPWIDPSAIARALCDWDDREVEELEEAGIIWTSRLVCKVLRGFHRTETAWKFFRWVAADRSEGFAHDRYTISRMIIILARSGQEKLVDELISEAKSDGIRLPFVTVQVVIELYGVSKRPEAAMRLFENVVSVCGQISDSDSMLLCSSLLRTLTKCWRGVDAMSELERSVSEGVFPDLQTLSGMMQFYANEGDLDSVQKLFGLGRQCGIKPDSFVYQVLIHAYVKHGRTTLALRMFEDMRNLNLVPDAATKDLLVRSLWKEDRRREVAYVEERCGQSAEGLPQAIPGCLWTMTAADLLWVHTIYTQNFAQDREKATC